jgi:hypothetical protein
MNQTISITKEYASGKMAEGDWIWGILNLEMV